MKASWALTALTALALSGAAVAQAPAAAPTCEVPAYLLSTESRLPKVGAAIKAGVLDILVIGSRSSTINTSDGTAYPGRLEMLLREKLPAVKVNVTVELQVKKTAAEIVDSFSGLVETKKPSLVIWQTGTVDAVRAVDPDDFGTAIDDGIVALQKSGVDVVLMNLQYSPRTETVISPGPYVDSMRVAAQEHNIPLFDRFAIMRQWSDAGDFDLFNPSPGLDLAKRVHDCLGRALTTFIIDAAREGAGSAVQR